MHLKKILPFLIILFRRLKMENRFQFMIITVKKLYCMFLPLGEQGVVSTCPCGTLAQNPSVVMVKLKFYKKMQKKKVGRYPRMYASIL